MPLTPIKVLLVEDSPVDRLLVQKTLASDPLAAFDITIAKKLAEGLHELARQSFDAVLLDLGLPDSQGLETFQTLHQPYPELPIVVLSGLADEEVATQTVQNGAQDYIVKSVASMSLLARSVRYAVERQQAQLKLRESEKRSLAIFQSSPIGISLADAATGVLLDVNNAFAAMWGYTRLEMIGQTLLELNLWTNPATYDETTRLLLETGSIENRILTAVKKSGESIIVQVSAELLELTGEKYILSNVTDITAARQAEEAQAKLETQLHQAQKMESIGRLAGGVAHDFNNLLTVILGYSELIQARLPLDNWAVGQLEQIRLAAKRAESLTRQLLAFSRKQILIPAVLDLNELVTNLRKMLERLIGEDIALITVLQPDLWRVTADPGQIEQVIMNLVVNARDAMSAGGRVTLETANVSLDPCINQTHSGAMKGSCVRLTVTDTGHGMDQATQTQIFEPFFTTKEQGKGTGLGLATVYGIIKQSGGEITIDSRPGQGTVFSIYLPACDTVPTVWDVPQSELAILPGRETILLVEDEQAVRELVQMALQDYGYTLLEADHGYQALAMARQQTVPIDLLITDVVMPNMNGRELAERLKALHPQTRILFMSGYTDDEVIQRGVQMAEVEFLPKPFSPKELAAKVREMLDK